MGDRMNWQWRMKILFVPSNRRRLPIERVERPSLGGSQGLRQPFQYPLKWRLRASSPFVTRAEFIRVSCKFYVEARTWRQKVRIPRIEIACFIFFFFLSLLSPFLSRVAAVRDSCVTPYLDPSDRCNRQFEERKRLRNEGYESPSEKSVSTYTGEL